MAQSRAALGMQEMRERRKKLNYTRRDYYATAEEHESLTVYLAKLRGKRKKK